MIYIVDNKEISSEEFKKLQESSNIRLKKVSENTYITLQKLQG